MIVGLLDVDAWSRGKVTFPNLALMKISAWHKSKGDWVEWYEPLMGTYDRVYVSKVFSDEYSKPYTDPIDSIEVYTGGSGFAFGLKEGHETYDPEKDKPLPDFIDHIMPDYSIYNIEDTAYGFLTKGCPRGCSFCHVEKMQGRRTITVARLSEFWGGQKNIVLLDPNLTASLDWNMHIHDLADSKAYVDFSQGLDARLLTVEKIQGLNNVKWKRIHFAWDNPDENLRPAFERIKTNLKGCNRNKVSAYVLTNYNSTFEQDLMRIQTLREFNIQPYVMIYRKHTAPKKVKQLQRWCSPFCFWKCETFDDYRYNHESTNRHP